MNKIKLRPMAIKPGQKREVRTQFGALCYRLRGGKVQVLMVTSRTRRRWIIPKGWPMPGETPTEAAMTEAWEEAGVKGKVSVVPVGIFSYLKRDDKESLPCMVVVFPVKVASLEKNFPEAKQRSRRWCSRKKAAKLASDPELGQLIAHFQP